jgi:ABC-type transport system involved in multi-copper enzyme maturation permease subunit
MSAATLSTIERGTWSPRELCGLLTAEVRKTLSTSSWWAALLLPAGLLCLGIGWSAVEAGSSAETSHGVALAFIGVSVALLLGVVCATAEYRHNTIATSYLGAADRPKLIVAKAAFAAVVGAVWAVVATAMSIVGLLLGGADVRGDLVPLLQTSAAAVPVFALTAVLGVGFGTLVGHQMMAVLGAVLYLALGEFLLALLAETVGVASLAQYLPRLSGIVSIDALIGMAEFRGEFDVTPPWWLPPLVFVGWTALFGLAGAAAAQRRDLS